MTWNSHYFLRQIERGNRITTADENVAQTHPPFEGGAALAAGDVFGMAALRRLPGFNTRPIAIRTIQSRRVIKRLCATPASYVYIPNELIRHSISSTAIWALKRSQCLHFLDFLIERELFLFQLWLLSLGADSWLSHFDTKLTWL